MILETRNCIREVSPIWTRRSDILKIDNLWKTQIQKFKTPKQSIKFVKTLNQTFKLHRVANRAGKTGKTGKTAFFEKGAGKAGKGHLFTYSRLEKLGKGFCDNIFYATFWFLILFSFLSFYISRLVFLQINIQTSLEKNIKFSQFFSFLTFLKNIYQ